MGIKGSGYDLLDKKLEELKSLIEGSGINQEQILNEMNEKERKVIEKVGGIDLMQAFMNMAGIPIGEGTSDNSESELDR